MGRGAKSFAFDASLVGRGTETDFTNDDAYVYTYEEMGCMVYLCTTSALVIPCDALGVCLFMFAWLASHTSLTPLSSLAGEHDE